MNNWVPSWPQTTFIVIITWLTFLDPDLAVFLVSVVICLYCGLFALIIMLAIMFRTLKKPQTTDKPEVKEEEWNYVLLSDYVSEQSPADVGDRIHSP